MKELKVNQVRPCCGPGAMNSNSRLHLIRFVPNTAVRVVNMTRNRRVDKADTKRLLRIAIRRLLSGIGCGLMIRRHERPRLVYESTNLFLLNGYIAVSIRPRKIGNNVTERERQNG